MGEDERSTYGLTCTDVVRLDAQIRYTYGCAMSIRQTANGNYEVRWRDRSGRHRSQRVPTRALAEQFDAEIKKQDVTQDAMQALIDGLVPEDEPNPYVVVHHQLPADLREALVEFNTFEGEARWAMGGPYPDDDPECGFDEQGRPLDIDGDVIERPSLEAVVERFLADFDAPLLWRILEDEGFGWPQ